MAKEKFKTKDLLFGALQLLTLDGLRRFDSEFDWKGDRWKFTAYRISKPLDVVRIDLRKVKEKTKTSPTP